MTTKRLFVSGCEFETLPIKVERSPFQERQRSDRGIVAQRQKNRFWIEQFPAQFQTQGKRDDAVKNGENQ